MKDTFGRRSAKPGAHRSRRTGVRVGERRLVAVLLVTALVLAACSSSHHNSTAPTTQATSGSATTTGSKSGPAAASDIGITATQIRIGAVIDVDASFDPGLFQKNINVMNAWAKTLNEHGGLAGRQIVVDFCDSKADPNTTANCIIQACSKDFALVGTAALSIANVSDFATCKNADGQPIGIPNLDAIAISTNVQCSTDVWEEVNDPTLCTTQSAASQTYTENRGDAIYYTSHFSNLHGVFVISSSSPNIDESQTALNEARIPAGIKADSGDYSSPESPTASELLPYVEVMKRAGSTYVQDDAGQDNSIQLAKEAALQGVNTVKVWGGDSGEYDTTFLQEGGSIVNNTYAELYSLPFYSEYQSNPALSALATGIGGIQNLDGNSLSSFLSALLFQDAVQKIVASGATLNRQSLITTLNTKETAFTADGIIGTTNVSGRQLSPCIVMFAVLNQKFQRVFPTQPGTFDCNPQNITQVQAKL